ncbi:class I SAM-dependent methyltransferase [Halobacillus fulvus]|nr:class I SAM-dependent methyltransferase [Halobacillus fulvus]
MSAITIIWNAYGGTLQPFKSKGCKVKMSYNRMAQVYDRLMESAPYDHWSEFTQRMVELHHPGVTQVLDLGCGTGEITLKLKDKGYKMTGVDLSEEMLAMAQQKAPVGISWLCQDMTDLKGLRGFDCVISYCDVFNYLTSEEHVQKAFRSAYEALEPSGLFLFDVHSIDHIYNHMYGQTFAEVYDDLSYIWFCDPGEREGQVVHDLTFFLESSVGAYERFDEKHVQQVYPIEKLKQWILQTGFDRVQVYSDFSTEPSEDGDRLFFVCKKES